VAAGHRRRAGFAEEPGTRGYSNLVASVPNCVVYRDEAAVASYCHMGNGGQWRTFDDVWSIQRKTAWIKTKGLLGTMVWEMSGDTGTLTPATDAGLRRRESDMFGRVLGVVLLSLSF
jgi:chitinase